MGTTLTEICDLFLPRVDDYSLVTINQVSGSLVLNTYIEPYLLDSIVEFDICDQDLTYTTTGSATDGFFTQDLSLENKVLLSQMMVIGWIQKSIQNLIHMKVLATDHDFKTTPQAPILTAKLALLNSKKEEVNQRLTNYGYKKNNWTQWKNQNFDGSS